MVTLSWHLHCLRVMFPFYLYFFVSGPPPTLSNPEALPLPTPRCHFFLPHNPAYFQMILILIGLTSSVFLLIILQGLYLRRLSSFFRWDSVGFVSDVQDSDELPSLFTDTICCAAF